MNVILETPRLRLRLLTLEDAAFIRRLNDNPNVRRYTGDGAVADDAAARDILRTRVLPQYERHGVGRWGVDLREHGPTIGWCGLRFEADPGSYDLGFRFFEEHWGRGYATEAAAATLAWGRSRFPGATITARARLENTASRRVLEKLGLVAVGEDDDCDGRVALYR